MIVDLSDNSEEAIRPPYAHVASRVGASSDAEDVVPNAAEQAPRSGADPSARDIGRALGIQLVLQRRVRPTRASR